MEFRYRLKTKPTENDEEIIQNQPFIPEKSTADAIIFPSTLSSESDHKMTNPNSSPPTMSSKSKRSDWRKDKLNIALLLFLYLLQGIPLGMAASIPLILQTYGATYSQQATFSFAFWPFSLKLLWAPVVDSLYFKKFGRRKTWLIPIQYLIGIVMITLSFRINNILITTDNKPSMFDIQY
jgi:PAT family acetyl-CoA transporter-like MFS transporter 1